ncbi:hypothetical protein CFP65_5404 [Kitasatospora sp. MMS16-BH015]|uniref:TIGR04222 domain-containing membrane protein n=1 Tax=Kitasatospora sp. MMS16-BH015 TaxID=2018025 RepID=UPI000CA34509|nr:TIGR04222 domain-containing membrane protein [Kitasatospora sp. MMS16-BH015]AUG80108.1 hypothetical protein CFP65_5404 [Kitasatospora sp. MMS16-BH015]
MWYWEFVLAAVLVVCAGLGVSTTRHRLRHVPNPAGLPGRGLPLLDTAFLAGGPARVADTLIVRMERDGRLIVSRDRYATVTDGQPRDEIEAVLIGTAGPARRERLDLLRAKVMCSGHVQRIGDQLADRGLMRRPDLIHRVVAARWVLLASLFTTLGLGTVATVAWLGRRGEAGTPPFFAFLGLLLLGLVWYASSRPGAARITPAGLRQLALMREGSPWRPSLALTGGGVFAALAPEDAVELGKVALDGPTALADLELRDALLAHAAAQSVRGGSKTLSSSGVDYGTGAAWCGGVDGGASCGSSGSTDSGGHHGGHHGHSGGSHSCGSSGHSGGHSGGHSSHSCGGHSGHSCGGHSSCGSSCGSS